MKTAILHRNPQPFLLLPALITFVWMRFGIVPVILTFLSTNTNMSDKLRLQVQYCGG
jgi:hypothetical protein